MATAMINGRRTVLPDRISSEQLRRVAGVQPGRNFMQRTAEGNFLVPPDAEVQVNNGDVFLDAPARVKGGSVKRPTVPS